MAVPPHCDDAGPPPRTPEVAPAHDLAVLEWPEDAAEAERLGREGVPRLLLVPHEEPPPQDVDSLTEWVRVPAEEREVAARVVALMRRARSSSILPCVDDHARISYRDRWTALSPTEARIAAVLCERYGEVVTTEELRSLASPPRGRAPSPAAFRVHLHRLRQRIASLGLEVVSVRNEGAVLQPVVPT